MAEPIPASVIVMTRNEERNLQHCLASVQEFSEVFVVDSASTDRTPEVAREHGATVVPFRWDGGYPKKKQWCLDRLPFSHDWVLYLDADEALTPEASGEISQLLASAPGGCGYFVRSDFVFLGRRLRYGHRTVKLALLDRRRARFEDIDDLDVGTATEVEAHYQPVVSGPTGVLRGRIVHDDRNSLFQYFDRHNRYSDWEATLRSRAVLGRHPESQPGLRSVRKRLFAVLPNRGIVAFVHSYVFRLGFLDGRAGLHYALARAFYYWQIRVKELELRRSAEP